MVNKKGCIYSSLSVSRGYFETVWDTVMKLRGGSDVMLGDIWLQFTSFTWDHTLVTQNTANHRGQKDIRCLDTFLEAKSTSARETVFPYH